MNSTRPGSNDRSNDSSGRSWIQETSRAWKNHWLLICGNLLLFGSLALTWVNFPYSFNVAGFELPMQAVVPHVHEFSYGLVGVVALTIGFCLRNRFRWALLLGAALALTVWMLVPGRMTFRQAPLLRRLSEESQAVPLIKAFTKRSLPQNYDASEAIRKHLDLLSPSGRLAFAFSFLGIGWYCFGLGAFLAAGYAISRAPGERKVVASLLLVSIPAIVLTSIAAPSLIAEHYFNRGSLARAAGHDKQAIVCYRKALKWDRWYPSGIELYNLIGQLEVHGGLAEGSAERAISHAVALRARAQYEAAISELEHAVRLQPALAKTVRHEAERMRADWGLACYQAGAIVAAVANWQQALDEDSKGRPLKSQPSLLYVLPFLARGNYELGRYQAGLDAARQWFEITVDHDSLRADAYSLSADCYAKLGRSAEARRDMPGFTP